MNEAATGETDFNRQEQVVKEKMDSTNKLTKAQPYNLHPKIQTNDCPSTYWSR